MIIINKSNSENNEMHEGHIMCAGAKLHTTNVGLSYEYRVVNNFLFINQKNSFFLREKKSVDLLFD